MWNTWRSWSFNISSRLCFHNSLFLSLSFLGDEEPAIPHHWQARIKLSDLDWKTKLSSNQCLVIFWPSMQRQSKTPGFSHAAVGETLWFLWLMRIRGIWFCGKRQQSQDKRFWHAMLVVFSLNLFESLWNNLSRWHSSMSRCIRTKKTSCKDTAYSSQMVLMIILKKATRPWWLGRLFILWPSNYVVIARAW